MNQAETIRLVKDLTEFKTVKGNKQEFNGSFDYIEKYFSDSDLEIRKHSFNNFTTMMILSDPDPEILLHGHIDIVDADSEMFEPEIRDGKIYGRGVGDMKAGVALLMQLMKNEVSETSLSVGLMIVSDEEIGGFNGAKKIVEEQLYQPEFVISAEPNNTEAYMEIITEQKGVIRAKITAEGKNAHGSKPWNGENAAEKLWKNYEKLKENFEGSKEKWSTTINLGAIHSGQTFNVVPDKAEAKLDIRWTEDYPPQKIQEDMEEIEDLKFDILSVDPMLKTDPENSYIRSIQKASEKVMEEKIKVSRKEAASDMRHFSGKEIPGIVFGPEAYNIHEDQEYVVINSFEDYYDIMRQFLKNIQ